MAEPLNCPNCKAPVEVDPARPTFKCSFCDTQSKNPLYSPPRPPRPARTTPAAAQKGCSGKAIAIGALVLAAIVAVVALRSDEKKKRPRKSSYSSSYSTRSRVDTPQDLALAAKLGAYDVCWSRHTFRVLQSRQRYLNWIGGGKQGPTCAERIKHGVYELYDLGDCLDRVQKVRKEAPRIAALERAGERYLAALKVLDPLQRRAARYYKQEDYNDDGCALGQKLHPQLMRAWKAVVDADGALRADLQTRRTRLLGQRLARAQKKQGKGVRYWAFKLQLDAQALVKLLEGGEAPDPAALKGAVDTFKTAVNTLEDASRKDRRAASMTLVKLYAGNLLAAAKQYQRHLASGQPHSRMYQRWIDTGMGWMVKGSAQRVWYEYNKLVGASARVRWR